MNENIPIATTTTAGLVKAVSTGSSGLPTIVDIDGTLRVQMPFGTTTGIYNTGTALYPYDGTWASKSFNSNTYNSLSFLYNSTRNYYSTSNFNTAYIYPINQNSSYPLTITIACYIGSSSYTYDLKPVNASGSTTATDHMLASSWDDIELVTGGWLVYTAKLLYSSTYSYKYLWTREVYSD